MHAPFKYAFALAVLALSTQAVAQVTFYEHPDFAGRSFTVDNEVVNFRNQGFNDRASSLVVWHSLWEVCDDARFSGRCVILRPGRYPSLAAMGLNNQVSSVRAVDWQARPDMHRLGPPPPLPVYDARRRPQERLYEARVLWVRAVVGPPDRRCWVEREQVVQEGDGANVPGAIFGAILGGILGHQIGDGTGQDIATAGGAVAGAALGANIDRDEDRVINRNVKRCETRPSQARPEYWDVVYEFNGMRHRVQMTSPPRGNSVTVNGQGEPRE